MNQIYVKDKKIVKESGRGVYMFPLPAKVEDGEHYLLEDTGRTEMYLTVLGTKYIYTWHKSGSGQLIKNMTIDIKSGNAFPTPRALLEEIGASGSSSTFATELPEEQLEMILSILGKKRCEDK